MTARAVAGQPAQSLAWNAEGQLASVSEGGGDTSEYTYTADGDRLVRKQDGKTTVYLPGGQEVTVDDATSVVTAQRYYTFNGETVAVRTSSGASGTTTIVADHHGTGLVQVAQATNTVHRRYMDPYGGQRGAVPAWTGDHGYLNKPTDATGLVQIGARYYDPGLGKFISVDPIIDVTDPQQWAPYSYSNSNPVTWSDPSGMMYMDHGPAPDCAVCGFKSTPAKDKTSVRVSPRVLENFPPRNWPVRARNAYYANPTPSAASVQRKADYERKQRVEARQKQEAAAKAAAKKKNEKKSWLARAWDTATDIYNEHEDAIIGGLKVGITVVALFTCTICTIAAYVSIGIAAYDTYQGYKKDGLTGAAVNAVSFVPAGGRVATSVRLARAKAVRSTMTPKNTARRGHAVRQLNKKTGSLERNRNQREMAMDVGAAVWSAGNYGASTYASYQE